MQMAADGVVTESRRSDITNLPNMQSTPPAFAAASQLSQARRKDGPLSVLHSLQGF